MTERWSKVKDAQGGLPSERVEELKKIRNYNATHPIQVRAVPDLLIATRRLGNRLLGDDPKRSTMSVIGGDLSAEIFAQTFFLSDRGEVQLFWVSSEMSALVREAAIQLPKDVRPIDSVTRPIPHGFAVFERPVPSWTANDEGLGPVHIGGLGWGGAASPRWDGQNRTAVVIIPFSSTLPGVSGLAPLSSTYLFPHATFAEHTANKVLIPEQRELKDEYYTESDENRRLVVALSMLLESTIVASETQQVPRAEARRAERGDAPSDVRIVRLRRTRHAGSEDDEELGSYVEWTHRWVVSGHWRNQVCGEARTQRRLTWVSPYIKGPEDKPLVLKQTVGALVR